MKLTTIICSAVLGAAVLLISGCAPAEVLPAAPTSPPAQAAKGEIANPASVFCGEHGGKSEIRTAADGSQSGVCVFPNGKECDEWAYFRGECGPDGTIAAPTGSTPGAGVPALPAQDRVVALLRDKLVSQLKVDITEVKVNQVEPTTWSDACLGLSQTNEVCTAVETPGYRVSLTVGGTQYIYHTNLDGSAIREEPAKPTPGG